MNPNVGISTAIDLRRSLELPPNQEGLLVTFSTMVSEGSASRFWDIARSAIVAVKAASSPPAIQGLLAASAGITTPDGASAFLRMAVLDVLISNLGKVSFGESSGRLRVTQLWGPAALTHVKNHQVLGIATLSGRLRMLHTSYDPAPSLLERLGEALDQACKLPPSPGSTVVLP